MVPEPVAYADWVRSAPPRTPNYLRFIVTGAIIGFLGGAIFSLVGESAADYSASAQIAFFGVMFAGIGALLAGLVAVLLERGS
jgi:MFS superfamily sulfate permease-like transporter